MLSTISETETQYTWLTDTQKKQLTLTLMDSIVHIAESTQQNKNMEPVYVKLMEAVQLIHEMEN